MPKNQTNDLIQPLPVPVKRTRANTQSRQQHKHGFVSMLLDDPRLDDGDKKAIRHASDVGLTAGDVAALVAYELRLAQKFYGDGITGSLASKDFIVALNKIASQAAAAAQMAAANVATNLPSKLEVTFTSAGASADVDAVLGNALDAD